MKEDINKWKIASLILIVLVLLFLIVEIVQESNKVDLIEFKIYKNKFNSIKNLADNSNWKTYSIIDFETKSVVILTNER